MLEGLSVKLSKYLSPQIYNSIFTGEQDVSLTTKRKKLTVFFSDLKDFTKTTEGLQPEDLTGVLNNYFSEMSTIALAHGATIDKFIGDAMMIFFGDPESDGEEQDALNCIEMAIRMKNRIEEMRDYWIRIGVKGGLNVRMGIATGYCTVGNFGSDQRMDYTALGSPVNLSARLQGKAPSNEILISDTTLNLIKDKINSEYFEEITPKGFARPVQIHLLKDFISEDHRNKRKSFSHRGKHVDINIFDTSDIKAAIEELKEVHSEFDKQIKS